MQRLFGYRDIENGHLMTYYSEIPEKNLQWLTCQMAPGNVNLQRQQENEWTDSLH